MSAVTTSSQHAEFEPLEALTRPVVILVGHAGSGKSEIAVNLAVRLTALGRRATLIDLDLIKPYFRSRIVRDALGDAGIEVVVPGGEMVYADIPIVCPEVRGHIGVARGGREGGRWGTEAERPTLLIDAGGNDNGARVLGSLAEVIDPNLTDLLFVVNISRPFADDSEALSRMVTDIENASGLKVTGLVSNTHLMDETTPEIIEKGLEASRALSRSSGVPLRFCGVPHNLFPLPSNKGEALGCPVLVVERYILPPHVQRKAGFRRALAL